jgi:hypothetical protein
MSDVKREILFQDSMTIDKRDPAFAYLRKNAFKSYAKGLYPSIDFEIERPEEDEAYTTTRIVDVLGSDAGNFDIKVIFERSSETLNFYNLGSNSSSNSALVDSGGYMCGTFGNDGVKIVTGNDKLYKLHHENSNTTEQHEFTEAIPRVAGFDGLYYWYLSNNEIYRQLDNDTPTVAFNDLGFSTTNPVQLVDFLNDQMVIFSQQGGDIVVLFWDKSDADLFDKRILIRNATLIAGGVVNGRLMLVKAVGNSSNAKERQGELVVCGYDGEKFIRMNAIKTGANDVEPMHLPTSVGVGSEVMIFSVNENDDSHNTDLYQNYIYKVHDDGAIEVVWQPNPVYGDVEITRVFQNFIAFAAIGAVGYPSAVFINEDVNNIYADFEKFSETVYITNFLNNPYNFHKLDGFCVAFEKLFEQTSPSAVPPTGEELDVYYRVSERDAFVLLGNVTVEKVKDNVNKRRDQSTEYASDSLGMPEQRYMFTKMPDGITALPQFNEIQFKFVSKRGFTIIGAWYEYSYLSRNKLN